MQWHYWNSNSYRRRVRDANVIPSRIRRALPYINGFRIRFRGLSRIFCAAFANLRSARDVQPCFPAHSLSWVRHAQSNLSSHGVLNVPPLSLYVLALWTLPLVQLGPHQRPWIRTMMHHYFFIAALVLRWAFFIRFWTLVRGCSFLSFFSSIPNLFE